MPLHGPDQACWGGGWCRIGRMLGWHEGRQGGLDGVEFRFLRSWMALRCVTFVCAWRCIASTTPMRGSCRGNGGLASRRRRNEAVDAVWRVG